MWQLGAFVYLTLFEPALLKPIEVITEYQDYFIANIQSFGWVWSVCLAILTRQVRELLIYPVSKRLTTFGFFTSYFFWWQFSPVTAGCGCVPNLVGDVTVKSSGGENWIPRLFYEENTILWLSFVCVVSNDDNTGKRYLKVASKQNTTYLWVVDFVFFLVKVCTFDCWVQFST